MNAEFFSQPNNEIGISLTASNEAERVLFNMLESQLRNNTARLSLLSSGQHRDAGHYRIAIGMTPIKDEKESHPPSPQDATITALALCKELIDATPYVEWHAHCVSCFFCMADHGTSHTDTCLYARAKALVDD